jgi:hypothetical protein
VFMIRGIYAEGSFDGNYAAIGNPNAMQAVLGCAFGAREEGSGLSNEALAGFIDDNFAHLPIIVGEDIAPALQVKPAKLIEGSRSTYLGKGVGTGGELDVAQEFMALEGLVGLILVGQAFHVPRIGRQAWLRRMDIAVPFGLPRIFDPESVQPWTRDENSWQKRERFAQPVVLVQDAVIIARQRLAAIMLRQSRPAQSP